MVKYRRKPKTRTITILAIVPFGQMHLLELTLEFLFEHIIKYH